MLEKQKITSTHLILKLNLLQSPISVHIQPSRVHIFHRTTPPHHEPIKRHRIAVPHSPLTPAAVIAALFERGTRVLSLIIIITLSARAVSIAHRKRALQAVTERRRHVSTAHSSREHVRGTVRLRQHVGDAQGRRLRGEVVHVRRRGAQSR